MELDERDDDSACAVLRASSIAAPSAASTSPATTAALPPSSQHRSQARPNSAHPSEHTPHSGPSYPAAHPYSLDDALSVHASSLKHGWSSVALPMARPRSRSGR